MQFYYILMIVMAVLALIVYIALFFIKAGYGYLTTPKWGPAINNKVAWILMEFPAFALLLVYTILFAVHNPDTGNSHIVLYIMAGFFLVHYFQRTFIFPLLMRGRSKMPVSVVIMGFVFNAINTFIIGGWLYRYAPAGKYPIDWLWSPQFIIGAVIFIVGMAINMDSDRVIRHLRKPGDTKHYIPRKHLYKYVTSANYFGEVVEWVGYAILTWSPAGLLFAVWTFANLAPRAKTLTDK